MIGEKIQNKGNEFGATTGRRRRCGWLDLPLLKYTVKASNISSIALTKLDVLSNLEQLKICTGYQLDDQEIHCAYPGLDLDQVTPIYEELTPFTDDFSTPNLSKELDHYIRKIEEYVGVKVGVLAYGPERSEIQFLKDYFS